MKNSFENIYLPRRAEIAEVKPLTGDVSLFTVKAADTVSYRPGQFFMLSVPGFGEVPISVTSAEDEPLRFCIRNAGSVTGAIHGLKAGDAIGMRGPYGNGFDLDMAKDKDVVVIAGGLGIVPLRPVIKYLLKRKSGKLYVLYGAKSSSDIIYRDELDLWSKSASVFTTVDCGDEEWKGCTGLVTGLIDNIKTDFSRAASFVCGPEVMIRSSMRELSGRGMPDGSIVTTLEAHMKCGVGKCGHCYIGKDYVCTDGPVFTLEKLRVLTVF